MAITKRKVKRRKVAATAAPVEVVWTPEDTVEPKRSLVSVKVNGESVGEVEDGETLKVIAGRFATNHGLKTFSVLVNGSKATTDQGGKTLKDLGARAVELVAKEARGKL